VNELQTFVTTWFITEKLSPLQLGLHHFNTPSKESSYTNMKSQLTDYKLGRKRNFLFLSILCSFFFEQVPGLCPRGQIIPHGPHDAAIAWWTKVMRLKGGGRVPIPYNDEFLF
jgi:hypothetical protein